MSFRVVAALFLGGFLMGGCAGDEGGPAMGEIGEEYRERMELPEQIEVAMERHQPGARVITWNRRVSDHNAVVFHVFYEGPNRQQQEVWIDAGGEILSREAVRELKF